MEERNKLAGWARGTLRPSCPACGGWLLPCTATATGVHPGDKLAPFEVDKLAAVDDGEVTS